MSHLLGKNTVLLVQYVIIAGPIGAKMMDAQFSLVDIADLKEVLLCQAMMLCTLMMLLQAMHRNWVPIFLALANDTLVNILIKKTG